MSEDTVNSDNIHRIEAIKTLYQLWSGENSGKTQKLTLFFTAQSILVAGYSLGSTTLYLIPIIGMAFSLLWLFSIGRTVAFQACWKAKIDTLLSNAPESVCKEFDFYPTVEDKKMMPFYGKMPGKYILLGPPVVGVPFWLGVFIHALTS